MNEVVTYLEIWIRAMKDKGHNKETQKASIAAIVEGILEVVYDE